MRNLFDSFKRFLEGNAVDFKKIAHWDNGELKIYDKNCYITCSVQFQNPKRDVFIAEGLARIYVNFNCLNTFTNPDFINQNKSKISKLLKDTLILRIKQIVQENQNWVNSKSNFFVEVYSNNPSYLLQSGIIKEVMTTVDPLISKFIPDTVTLGNWENKRTSGEEVIYVKYYHVPEEIDWRPTDTVPEDFYAQ